MSNVGVRERKRQVVITLTVPDGATHYSGWFGDRYHSWLKCEVVDGEEQWYWYAESQREWMPYRKPIRSGARELRFLPDDR